MPHYFTASDASMIASQAGDIANLLPEPENVPGRSPETEKDLSKWKIEELAQQMFMIGVQHPVQKQKIDGQSYEPYPEKAVEEMLPYIEELGKRCRGYLDNPEYGAEKRPVLNAYLKNVGIKTEMCEKGVNFDRTLIDHGMAGQVATLQLMDTVLPKVDKLSAEERKNTLDAYEKKAKEGPFFDLIHNGLDQMQITGEYEAARLDEKHPMTVSERAGFEERAKNKLTEIHEGIQKIYQCLDDEKFKLEDYPYMNTKTVQNLKESRGLPNAKTCALRERALLEGGDHMEDYRKTYHMNHLVASIENDAEKMYKVLPDAKLQTNEKVMEWMTLLDQVKDQGRDLDTQPDKISKIKEDLAKQGITMNAYIQGMQEKLMEGAAELKADPTISEAERQFFAYAETRLAEEKKDHGVSKAETEKAKDYISTRAKKETAEILESKKADLELDRELTENGYGMPERWQPQESTELMTEMDITNLVGATVKMKGIIGEKGARYVGEFTTKMNHSELGQNGTFQYYGIGNGFVRQYSEAAMDELTGEVIHPAEEMRTLLQDMNRDARQAMTETPSGNKLQRAMQGYVESLTREALDHKEPIIDRGKDAFQSYANGMWANITEPGEGRNLKWPEAERLDAKFGFGTIMQDCVTLHEINRSSTQRETAGIVDAAKEQKERELYGKLLDRVEKNAQKILDTPEADRPEIAGLFDATNQKNAKIDIFEDRGVKIVVNTAKDYREGLKNGWPIHELPLHSAVKHYAELYERAMNLMDPEMAAGMKKSVDALKETLNRDIGGLNEKEKSDFFKGLSESVTDINRQKAEMMQNPVISQEAMSKLSHSGVKTGNGTGRDISNGILPDALVQAAQNSMKRAVTMGQARPQELAGLQTEMQRNSLEDATLMMNRTGEAYSFVAKAQFKYQQMYKELQSLKKSGEKNSEYFQNMEKALKTLSGMDGKKSPAQLTEAYRAMEDAAQTYVDKRSGFFSAWSKNGKDRRSFASRLAEQACQDRKELQSMVQRDDRLPNVPGQDGYLEAIRSARNGVRGPLNEHESLESQLLRYSNAVEQFTPPKMAMENNMQKQKDTGALNAIKQKQPDKQAEKEKAAQKAQEAQKKETQKEAKKEVKKELVKQPAKGVGKK